MGVLGDVECHRKGEAGDPGMLEDTSVKGHFVIKVWSFPARKEEQLS